MTIVWAVGCYDYDETCIPAIFTSRELAQAHADELNATSSNEYDIEPYPIMDSPARKVTWYASGFYKDGQQITKPHEGWNYEYPSDPYVSGRTKLGPLYQMAWGTDKEATEEALRKALEED